jgi:hypothetical protein
LKKNIFGTLTLLVGVVLAGAIALSLIGCDTGNGPDNGGNDGGGGNGMGNPNTGSSTPAQAIQLTPGEWITASIATGEEQWFSYVPPEDSFYSIHVRLGTIDRVILERYNSALTHWGGRTPFSKNASNPVLLETTGTVTAGQTNYIKMYPDEGESGGTYQIGFTGIPRHFSQAKSVRQLPIPR